MNKKILIALGVVLFAIVAYFVGRYTLDWMADQKFEQALQEKNLQILELSGLSGIDTYPEFADRARAYVHDNSQFKMDDEFNSIWPDKIKLAQAFIDGQQGKRKDLPHMECSTRSNILADLLVLKGYKVRNVVLYSPERNLSNHRLIEMKNPETGRWEAIDVTYNIYWRNKETKVRASMAEVGENPDAFEPCNNKQCSWDVKNDDGDTPKNLLDLMKIAAFHNQETDLRLTLYAPDINPAHEYKMEDKTGTFCDFFGKNCVDGFLPMKDQKEDVATAD